MRRRAVAGPDAWRRRRDDGRGSAYVAGMADSAGSGLPRDVETEIVEAAERAAVFYKTLRRSAIDDLPARALTAAWLLATVRESRDDWHITFGSPDDPTE